VLSIFDYAGAEVFDGAVAHVEDAAFFEGVGEGDEGISAGLLVTAAHLTLSRASITGVRGYGVAVRGASTASISDLVVKDAILDGYYSGGLLVMRRDRKSKKAMK